MPLRLSLAIASLLALSAFAACSKDESKTKATSDVDAAAAHDVPIDPGLQLPPGIDPRAPMVPLVEPSANASVAPSASGAPSAVASGGKPAAAGSTAAAAAKPGRGQPQIAVKLLAPGDPPRKKLRYSIVAGLTETLEEELRSSGAIETPQGAQDLGGPPIKVTMLVNPTDVSPNGDVKFTYTIKNAGLAGTVPAGADPELMAEVRQDFARLTNVGGYVVVTSRGLTKDAADLNPPRGASEITAQLITQMRQAVTEIMPPFPEEEVGKGAKWEKTTTVTSGPTTAVQKETFTLTDLQDNHGTIEVALEQSAPSQTLPAGADGVVRKLEESKATGHVVTSFDLTRIVPAHQTVDATSTAVQSLTKGDQSMRAKITLNMRATIVGTKP